ncbi:hypothetical protein GCM10025881_29860 [Pseudolysinimonas kribbensis]|uniref:Uncharacterized protein n=1 Tax=Pseudolysinimonas kribbensis TaxID=433641 RepID=A0ABQ6K6A9_9MICO|nr:hypothetical protein GCM10025881_29860 [Pseudolysinimonas kribbensis]
MPRRGGRHLAVRDRAGAGADPGTRDGAGAPARGARSRPETRGTEAGRAARGHPGGVLLPEGARGVTSKGTPMVCSHKVGDPRLRWRSAG